MALARFVVETLVISLLILFFFALLIIHFGVLIAAACVARPPQCSDLSLRHLYWFDILAAVELFLGLGVVFRLCHKLSLLLQVNAFVVVSHDGGEVL